MKGNGLEHYQKTVNIPQPKTGKQIITAMKTIAREL